jgi:hypothetical protein
LHCRQPLIEPFQRAEHGVLRDRHPDELAHHRPNDPGQLAPERKDTVHPPRQHLGEREEPQRLGGRRAVDDQQVETVVVGQPGQVGEGDDLLETGEQGELFGLDATHTGPVEHGRQIAAEITPLLFEAPEGIDLLAIQPGGQLARTVTERQPERVGQ